MAGGWKRVAVAVAVAASLVVVAVGQVPNHAAHATTSGGSVVGNLLPRAKEFLGLPYASHTQRFAPAADWPLGKRYGSDPLDATAFGPACLQYFSNTTTYGVEDCFVANVWQPADATPDSQLPVLMFIYGGSWDFDEAEPYNASALAADQQVVVVSINYRVGPLGFAAFEDQASNGETTGNWGMLDMQAGLRWIQREITNFGGDPARVGIFGQSSGGEGVEVLTVAPSSKGLFIGALSQSGGMSARTLASAVNTTTTLAHAVKCTGGASTLLDCMRNADADQIIFRQDQQAPGPVTDGVFLPEDPKVLLDTGKLLDVGVLWGANTNDSFLDISEDYTNDNGTLQHVNASWYTTLVKERYSNRSVAARVLELYPAHTNANNLLSLGWSASDSMLCEQRRNLKAAAKTPGRKHGQWMYRYDHWFKSNKTCTAQSNWHPNEYGSMHQDEVSFVFGQPIFMFDGYTNCSTPGWDGYDTGCLGCVYNDAEAEFAKQVGRFWSNMAATGNPNLRRTAAAGGAGEHGVAAAAWTSYGPGSDVNIVLRPTPGNAFEVEEHLGDRHCDFWDTV